MADLIDTVRGLSSFHREFEERAEAISRKIETQSQKIKETSQKIEAQSQKIKDVSLRINNTKEKINIMEKKNSASLHNIDTLSQQLDDFQNELTRHFAKNDTAQ